MKKNLLMSSLLILTIISGLSGCQKEIAKKVAKTVAKEVVANLAADVIVEGSKNILHNSMNNSNKKIEQQNNETVETYVVEPDLNNTSSYTSSEEQVVTQLEVSSENQNNPIVETEVPDNSVAYENTSNFYTDNQ